MSMLAEVREFLRTHSGKQYNNAALREAMATDDGQAISVALNQLHKNKEVSRARSDAGGGFHYWMGAAPASTARTVNGKDTADDDDEKPSMPASTVKEIERVLDAAERGRKKKSKNAGPKQSRVKRKVKADAMAKTKRKYTRKAKPANAPKVKRKYTHRAPPQEQTPSPAAVALDSSAAVFAIRQDGELGIDRDGQAVSLPRMEVQRLQAFLKTVAPLWSLEQ